MADLRELIDEWRELRDRCKELESEKSACERERAKVGAKIRELMQDQKLQTVKTDENETVYLHRIFNISVTQDNEADLRGWLIETFGDDQGFLETKVNKSAVTERIKRALDNDELGEFDVPDYLKLNTHPDVRMRKAK